MAVRSVKESDKNNIEFDIENVDVSLVNGLRRIMLSEFPTVGFNTDDYLNSDLKIIENTSFLHNEMLGHRMSLIPINASPDDWNPKKLEFTLEVENTSKEALVVTSGDIVVTDTEEQKKLDTKRFFPPNPITGDNIVIVVLKPNPGEEGQKINIKGIATVGTGQMHSRYSPVCKAVYHFVRDAEKVKSAMDKAVSTAEDKKRAKLDFELGEADRYFSVNERGQPNKFHFEIESIGVFPARIIYNKSVDIFLKKIEKIEKILSQLETEDTDLEEATLRRASDTINDTYKLTLNNETHTLGHVFCKHASIIYSKEEMTYIGYRNPHPLKNYIEIDIAPNPLTFEKAKEYFGRICTVVKDTLQTITL